MRIKRFTLGVAVGLACLALAACGSSSSTSSATSSASSSQATATSAAASTNKTPVTLAMVAYKLPGIDLVTPMSAGADAAAAQINAAGGFGGRKLVITTCNSMLQPAAAVLCAHKVVGEHALAMFGCEDAWAVGALQVVTAAKIPSFNCPTSGLADSTSPWAFGLVPSNGEDQGVASYICTLPDVKTVSFIAVGVPSEVSTFAAVDKVFKACGKTAIPVYEPETTTDISPYVQKVIGAKPGFVMADVFAGQIETIVQQLEASGIPASKVATSISILPQATLNTVGKSLDGINTEWQFTPYTQTSDPTVSAYISGMKALGADPQNENSEWGYSNVMAIYTAAKRIGFANFNSNTLAAFMRTANNVPIPVSRDIVNPGPSGGPSVKQPYVLIAQWTGSTFKVVPTGPNDDGWVRAWLY